MMGIRVSQAAKERIFTVLSERPDQIVPAIVWATSGGTTSGWWELTFYPRNRIPQRDLIIVDGVELAIDGLPGYVSLLEGKLIDVVNEQLTIV